MTKEEVIKLDRNLHSLWFDKDHTYPPEEALREKWEYIRNSESILAYATSVINNREFLTPTIASLILLDYKNVDKLAYDVIINHIYNKANRSFQNRTDPSLHNAVPDFLKDYGLTYLTATLFNENLELSEKRKEFLINIASLCFGSKEVADKFLFFLNNKNEINEIKLFQGKYPIDLRYFILEHPAFKDRKDELISEFFIVSDGYTSINEYPIREYEELMKNYEVRAKLRSLKKLPF